MNHLVFAEPDNTAARELQARALEQLAFGAENGTWRNFYLMGALELREGPAGSAATIPGDFVVNLTDEQLFDALAIQIDGPRAADRHLRLHWRFTDTGREYTLTLRHGVLSHRPGAPAVAADAIITIERATLNELMAGATSIEAIVGDGRLTIEGDHAALGDVLGLLDPPDPGFAIVTP